MNTQSRFPNGLIAADPSELLAARRAAETLIKAIDAEIVTREHLTQPKTDLFDVKARWGFQLDNGDYAVYDEITDAAKAIVGERHDEQSVYQVHRVYR